MTGGIVAGEGPAAATAKVPTVGSLLLPVYCIGCLFLPVLLRSFLRLELLLPALLLVALLAWRLRSRLRDWERRRLTSPLVRAGVMLSLTIIVVAGLLEYTALGLTDLGVLRQYAPMQTVALTGPLSRGGRWLTSSCMPNNR